MKNFTTYMVLIALVLTFSACKKSKESLDAKAANNQIDIKQYVITGTLNRTISGKVFEHPYLITFDDDGKCSIYDFSAVGIIQASYTFTDNILTVNYGGKTNWIFTISEESIIKSENVQSYYLSRTLYKIPGTNQFTGNWYSGNLNSRENKSALFFAYKFTNGQFEETVHITPQTYNYTLIKNIMAIATENGIARYFLALNGKLAVSNYNFGIDPPANFYYGALSKDQ